MKTNLKTKKTFFTQVYDIGPYRLFSVGLHVYDGIVVNVCIWRWNMRAGWQ